MDPDQQSEIRDILTDALASTTEAAAAIASALGIGSETDAGYEVDAEELEASDDPVAQAVGRALTAIDEALEELEGAAPVDDASADDDAAAA